MLNLDTHILVFALDQDQLTPAERDLLRAEQWGISAIVLWEIEMLHARGRIRCGLDDPRIAKALDIVTVWPITREVCLALRTLDFHADPADELIAATSLVHGVPLVTRDARIRASRRVSFR